LRYSSQLLPNPLSQLLESDDGLSQVVGWDQLSCMFIPYPLQIPCRSVPGSL